ncbi:MAG TPA: 2-hydroxyacid dehydrogenase [Pirellulaceae bacterium]|jgi:D-lactate dehydrogenase|nr:2-hydroxyacid dehydrogenase [Pirellulaceae bacterium]
MQVAVFSAKSYDRTFLERAAEGTPIRWTFVEARLSAETAIVAEGCDAVCAFVNDRLDAPALERLAGHGVRMIALRCAGFNQVDLEAAARLEMSVARVPAYSPYAVAEHTIGLILSAIRRIHKAYARVREGNFSLDGLLGFDLNGKTAAVVGTGKIGLLVAKLLHAFGCRVLLYDPYPSEEASAWGEYVSLDEALSQADVVTLHCPLTPETRHLIDAATLARCKQGVTLINTSRGALVDTRAVIDALKSGKIGALALDVYEEESELFFENLSDRVIQDDLFTRLLTFPNVVITSHQAFFTREAMEGIAATTVKNLIDFHDGKPLANAVCQQRIARA